MLFKISLSNIRRSMRDYAIYFFTLLIGVSIFYVFNAIDSQTSFLKVSERTEEIIELLVNMLSGMSVFVSIVLGLLIVYASRFLMKRRSKEFALYLMLGMGKGRISAILLIETIFIGIISLGIGLIAGIGISQIMSAFTASLFEADMTAYKFTVSGEAILKTIIYFGIIYLAVMLLNSFMVGKYKLIDLMQSGKKSEKLKLKNPALCIIIFLISVCGLAYAYYNVGWNNMNTNGKKIMIMIAIGAAATFLIFWSVSGMLLRVIMSMKSVYFRGLNSFTFRQISSKVNTMVMSMTVICLMLFVTICALSSAFSMRNSMNANLNKLCPADCEITLESEDKSSDDLSGIIEDKSLTENFEDYVYLKRYCDDDFTIEKTFGDQIDSLKEQYPSIIIDASQDIYKLSDYNALMELYGREPISLNDDEFAVISNFDSSTQLLNKLLKPKQNISVFGNTLTLKYEECLDGFIDISVQEINAGFYVVPDSAVDESCGNKEYFIGNYNGQSKDEKSDIEEQVKSWYNDFSKELDNNIIRDINTRIAIAEASVGLGALVTFLGLYIGIVFLISCGAILALKALSEDVDSIPRYTMLRKIGAEENEISKSLFRQTGIFFLLPLLLASVHSIFGMKFALLILQTFGTEKLSESVLFTSIIILLIYGGYFLITYFCGKSIIRDKR